MRPLPSALAISLLLTLSACTGSSESQAPATVDERQVDQFTHDGHTVTVFFADPLVPVVTETPGFRDLTPREQGQALADYLRNHAIYRFEVATAEGEAVGSLVLEGDPALTDVPWFYRVAEYRSGSDERTGVEPVRGVRGYLFEHMAPFQTASGRDAVGKGIAFFPGIIMMVQPYADVKEAILPHLSRLVG